jgi:ABC-type bacteriocin/lantibiotic exporter with double-glycine peptidase domain
MADLFSVYGMMEEPVQPPPQMPAMNTSFPPAPEMTQQGKPVKQMVSLQQPTEVVYQPPPAMYTQQEPQPQIVPTESFWDRISQKRYEILKVFVLSLIVLLAISMDHVFTHYLTQYISNSLLTTLQEFLVRISYPVAILLVIWFIKSM